MMEAVKAVIQTPLSGASVLLPAVVAVHGQASRALLSEERFHFAARCMGASPSCYPPLGRPPKSADLLALVHANTSARQCPDQRIAHWTLPSDSADSNQPAAVDVTEAADQYAEVFKANKSNDVRAGRLFAPDPRVCPLRKCPYSQSSNVHSLLCFALLCFALLCGWSPGRTTGRSALRSVSTKRLVRHLHLAPATCPCIRA